MLIMDQLRKVISEKYVQEWSKDGSLWNTTRNLQEWRKTPIYTNSLRSVSQVTMDPLQSIVVKGMYSVIICNRVKSF